ncbi:MAG TPA: extracellular solute-binding protein, partial [Aggregatilineales bacterium]|nr:extracellular solute-binding protein [Aggregatilineales bacterium]
MKKLIRLLIPVLMIGLAFAQGSIIKAQSPVKIVMWSIADETDALHKTMLDAIDRYNKAHAGKVEVDVTFIHNDQFKPQLEIAIAGGKTPDIFQTWGGGVLQAQVAAGVVRDIPALLGDAGKKFAAGGFGPATINGKRYAVPVDLSGVFLWVNNDLLQQNNVPLPDTWDTLISDCKALHDKGVIPIGLTNKDKWPGAFYAYYLVDRIGGSQAFLNAFNRKGSFQDPPFIQAGKMIQDAVNANCFEPGYNGDTWDSGQVLFGGGQVVMQLQGNWLLDGAKKGGLDPKSLKALPFPSVAGGMGDPTDMIGGTGQSYAISAKAPKEADDAVIEMLSSPEFAQSVAVDASLMPAAAGGAEYIKD